MLSAGRGMQWRAALRWTRLVAAGVVLLGVVAALRPIGDGSLYAGPRWLNVVISLLTTTTLFWCWRHPLPAVVWVGFLMGLSQPLVPHDISFVPGFFVVIAVTAVAAYRRPGRPALLALGVTVAAIVVAVQDIPGNDLANVVVNVVLVTVPWAGAWMLRVREQHAEELGARLATLEVESAARHERAVAAERARIARELHDVVAHSVSVMVIQTGAARSVLDVDPAGARRSLLTAETTGRQALVELARMLDLLRAAGTSGVDGAAVSLAPQPSLTRLGDLVEPARLAGQDVGLDLTLQVAPDLGDLPPSLDLCAYRILQEGLTNALRYAAAGAAQVSVDRTPHELHLVVRNGLRPVGDPTPGRLTEGRLTEGRLTEGRLTDGGHGLVGMAERAALFGGTCHAGPDGDGGWLVDVRLPLPADPDQTSEPAPSVTSETVA